MGLLVDNSKDTEEERFSYYEEIEKTDLCIIIDMQEGFRAIESELIVSKISSLIEENDSWEFVMTKFINQKGSLFETQLQNNKFQDKEEQKIMKEFEEYNLREFKHSGYSVLTDEFKKYLNENNFKNIYLTGINTDTTIKLAAMEMFDLGYKVFVVREGVNTLHGRDVQSASVESLKKILGERQVI